VGAGDSAARRSVSDVKLSDPIVSGRSGIHVGSSAGGEILGELKVAEVMNRTRPDSLTTSWRDAEPEPDLDHRRHHDS
jgi:hypothetical protein